MLGAIIRTALFMFRKNVIMKYLFVIIFAISSMDFVFAQTDESVINSIFDELFPPIVYSSFKDHRDTILISSSRYRTSFDFDSITFRNETGLMVPTDIIIELCKNVEPKDYASHWNQDELNRTDTTYLPNDTVIGLKPFIKCLSEDEKMFLFEKTKKRHRINFITKILFDDKRENAVFDFGNTPWPGYFSSQKIFIKKVFGKWVIITRFYFMMS